MIKKIASLIKTSLRSSQPHSNSMCELTTNLDNSSIKSYNFLDIQKTKFKDLKVNTILFYW